MTREDALKRLAQCRENQHDAMQVVVAGEIVDALLSTDDDCDRFRKALERIAGAQSGHWGWVANDALVGVSHPEERAA